MPSTLIELMLRSPDSSNLAKASLWEEQREGGNKGPRPGVSASSEGLWLRVCTGPVRSQHLNSVPKAPKFQP